MNINELNRTIIGHATLISHWGCNFCTEQYTHSIFHNQFAWEHFLWAQQRVRDFLFPWAVLPEWQHSSSSKYCDAKQLSFGWGLAVGRCSLILIWCRGGGWMGGWRWKVGGDRICWSSKIWWLRERGLPIEWESMGKFRKTYFEWDLNYICSIIFFL